MKYLYILFLTSITIFAATIDVDTLDDEDNGCSPGACSLREAIAEAAWDDIITISVPGTIILNDVIAMDRKHLSIEGKSQENTIISGNYINRIFYIDGFSDVAMSNLTLQDANNSNEVSGHGGAILLDDRSATLRLNSVTVKNNYAKYAGGGVVNRGTLSINHSIFQNNRADTSAAGISSSGDLSITDSLFEYNHAKSNGGAINFNSRSTTEAFLEIHTTVFKYNSTLHNDGGAIYVGNHYEEKTHTLVYDSYFLENNATYCGGAIYASGAINVNRSLFKANRSATGSALCFKDYANKKIHATGDKITNSTMYENHASQGGTILVDVNESIAEVKLSNITMVQNSADNVTAGIYLKEGNVSVKNSILANRVLGSGNDCYINDMADTRFSSNGYNFVEYDECLGFTHDNDTLGIQPSMMGLADNGGYTDTNALAEDSIAVGSASCSDNDGDRVRTDQRGVRRASENCDAGAYEIGGEFEDGAMPALFYLLF